MEEIKKETQWCSGNCCKCHKYVEVVPDPTDPDPFNDDDVAMFCKNPNNSMEREWTSPSQRQKIMSNPTYAKYVNEKGWTFIGGMLRPYELDKIHGGNVEIN